MKSRTVLGIIGVAVSASLILAGSSGWAQKTKGKTREAATKYLMRGITQPHCKALADGFKESGPADDKAWDAVACHAACLSELSYLLMDDGRCPDGTWAGAAKKLREGSAAVARAAEAKDLDQAKAGFKTVTQSCGACHKAHKKS